MNGDVAILARCKTEQNAYRWVFLFLCRCKQLHGWLPTRDSPFLCEEKECVGRPPQLTLISVSCLVVSFFMCFLSRCFSEVLSSWRLETKVKSTFLVTPSMCYFLCTNSRHTLKTSLCRAFYWRKPYRAHTFDLLSFHMYKPQSNFNSRQRRKSTVAARKKRN